MLTDRVLARSAQRFAAARPLVRSSVSRRMYSSAKPEPTPWKVQDNAFNRSRAASTAHAAESSEFWRKASIYVVIPALIIFSANAYTLWNEHWEHEAHEPPHSERPQYPYLNVRTKPYPWGDGNKTLFWNDKHNYVKDP